MNENHNHTNRLYFLKKHIFFIIKIMSTYGIFHLQLSSKIIEKKNTKLETAKKSENWKNEK